MAKGYWIGHITVKDADAYERYKEANAVPFAKYGGEFIVRGGRFECLSGIIESLTNDYIGTFIYGPTDHFVKHFSHF